jgi:acyl carrier protein
MEMTVSQQSIEQQVHLTTVADPMDLDTEVFRTFREVVSKQLDVPLEKVTPEATLVDDLGADSLQIIELSLTLEEKFSIDLPDRELGNFRTVGSAVKRLSQLIAEKRATAA